MRVFLSRTRDRLGWSWAGVTVCWREQSSFRYWAYAYGLSVVLALVLPLSGGDRALVLSLGIMVMAAEAMNSAIEYTVDYISTDRHPLAGRAKDTASAAVFLTAIAAGVAWICVLIGLYWG